MKPRRLELHPVPTDLSFVVSWLRPTFGQVSYPITEETWPQIFSFVEEHSRGAGGYSKAIRPDQLSITLPEKVDTLQQALEVAAGLVNEALGATGQDLKNSDRNYLSRQEKRSDNRRFGGRDKNRD